MIRLLIYNNNIIENILDIMNMFPNRKFPLFRFSTSHRFFSNSSCRTQQRTLKKSIYFSGISLHNGKQVNLSIELLTGKITSSDKTRILKGLKLGTVDIIIDF